MIDCPTRQQLEQYLDERLDGPERALIEAHVADCQACQRILEEASCAADTAQLRALQGRRTPNAHEPKGDLLRRIEQAASRSARAKEVVIEATGAYHSPDRPLPVAGSLSDQKTRHAPPHMSGDGFMENGLLAGTMLGQYRIEDQLGAGGMGQVYKAIHIAMDRVVALKVIAPHLLKDARARARFQQEVRTAAKLHHPNIVMAHDAAEADGLSFLVMEHVEGTTLSSLISEQGLPPVPLACEIIRQAALGLQHAHDKGMVHRDIKPGNLMVSAQQTPGSGAIVSAVPRRAAMPGWPMAPLVKILDFGVARLREISSDGEPVKMKTLTQEGCVVGTPEFMSPEQACDSRNVDVRSDIYSLGCTFYFLLTGRPPFSATTALETMVQHLKNPLPPVDKLRPGLAPGLVAIVHKMLAKSAEARFQTPAELAEALLPWTGDFASAVGPDAIVIQRGLAPTAPASLEALQATSDLPAADTRPESASPIRHREVKPADSWGGTSTFLALLLLFLVSAGAFWIFLTFFDRPGPDEEEKPEPHPNVLHMTFVRYPAGPFRRASNPRGKETTLTHPLEVCVTEVTRGQFGHFVREYPDYQTLAEREGGLNAGSLVCNQSGGRQWEAAVTWKQCGVADDDAPVTCVAWEDAVAFCNWLSRQESKKPCYEQQGEGWTCNFNADGYRLPTDAEWEYAARAGLDKLLPAPDAMMQDYGWFLSNAGGHPNLVGHLAHNPRDLFDVWGNVWEWCWDWHAPLPKDRAMTDPTGPSGGTERVIWGGGWNDPIAEVARSPRRGLPPEHRATDVGFRVVRSIVAH